MALKRPDSSNEPSMAEKLRQAKIVADEVKNENPEEEDEWFSVRPNPGNFDMVVSTGCTELDLAISGDRVRGGGIPVGIAVEIYGPNSIGKTAVISEILASMKIRGGDCDFLDPEARIDKEYAKKFGIDFSEVGYGVPDTVEDVFKHLDRVISNQREGVPIGVGTDSLAALSSHLEQDKDQKGDSKDKRGQAQAKAFSKGFREFCRKIRDKQILLICSNQIRDTDYGKESPGGHAIKFYTSLRIQLTKPAQNHYITRKMKVFGIDQEVIDGIMVNFEIKKSSVAPPHRKGQIYIRHNYGIDDVYGNLQWLKSNVYGKYVLPDGKELKVTKAAVNYVEKEGLEQALREDVISKWEEIQEKLTITRKKKQRI